MKNRSSAKAVWLVIAAHLAITSVLAWYYNIWADESCTLYSTWGSPKFVIEKALYFEWQPPAYHLTLRLWRSINQSIFFARCFGILCTSITIWTLFKIAEQLQFKSRTMLAALFALHPFAIYLATEIRLYGFATMISAISLRAMLSSYMVVEKIGSVWTHTVTAIWGLYTNILLAVPVVAQAMTVVLFRKQSFQRLFVQLFIAAAIFAPIFLYQLSIAHETELLPSHNTIANLTSYVLGSIEYMVLPLPRVPATVLWRGGLLVVLLSFCLFVGYRYRRRIGELHQFAFVYLGLHAVGLAAFVLLTHVARAERYTYILVAPALVAWAAMLDLIPKPNLRRTAWICSLVFCLVTSIIENRTLCKTGDWIRVADYLQATEDKDEPIVAFPSEVHTLLNYYYQGANQIVPVPGPQRFDRFTMNDFRIPDRSTLQDVLSPQLRGINRFKLVVFNPAVYRTDSDDPLNFALLEAFLDEDFMEVDRQTFVDSTVRTLERRSPPSADPPPDRGR